MLGTGHTYLLLVLIGLPTSVVIAQNNKLLIILIENCSGNFEGNYCEHSRVVLHNP